MALFILTPSTIKRTLFASKPRKIGLPPAKLLFWMVTEGDNNNNSALVAVFEFWICC